MSLAVPDDCTALHRLIEDIKLTGHSTPELSRRLGAIVAELDVDHVLLACTELPLIDLDSTIDIWDVTAMLADALVQAASS